MDVDPLFAPLDHLDIVLEEKGIRRYDEDIGSSSSGGLAARYESFLTGSSRKRYARAIDHDAQVLSHVKSLRSAATSSLEAEALLLTCDYSLNAFDKQESAEEYGLPSTVVPNTLWQVLRPFVPSTDDFDVGFASTFALPELRTVSQESQAASAKLASILRGYAGLSEEAATRMLANDMLLKRMAEETDESRYFEYVESAIGAHNLELEEHNLTLQRSLEEQQVKADRAAQDAESGKLELASRIRELQGSSEAKDERIAA